MTQTTTTFETHDGTEIFVREWKTDSPRYELLIVHGLAEHSGRFDHVAAFFNRAGANVTAFDVRGHGKSAGIRTHAESWEDLHADIEEVARRTVDASGLPWVLYGHSFGGLQCAGYLIDRHEPRPNVAVLSSPVMRSTRPVDKVLKVVAHVLGRVAPKLRIDPGVKGHQLSTDPAVGEAYFSDELVEEKMTTRKGLLALKEMERLAPLHETIDIPTLVTHGADDTLIFPKASSGLAASPSVERRLFPGYRHEPHNEPREAAESFLGDISDWIDKKLFGSS